MKRVILITLVGLLGLTAFAQEDTGDEKVVKTKRIRVEVKEVDGETDTTMMEEEIVMEDMAIDAEIQAKLQEIQEILKEQLGNIDSIKSLEDLEKLENLEELEDLKELEDLEELIEERVEMQMRVHLGDSARGPKKPKVVETNMWVLEWGLNNWVSSNGMDLPEAYDSWGLKSRSANFHLGIIQQGINLSKGKLRLVYGAGIEFNNYRFENGVTITKGSKPVEFEVNEDVEYKTNKITSRYLTIPLMLNYKSNPRDEDKSFKIAAGVQGGYLIGAHQKQKWGERDEKEKKKVSGNYGFSDYRYGYVAQLGYGDFVLYAKYYPTPTFKDNRGPEMNTACVGFVLSPF